MLTQTVLMILLLTIQGPAGRPHVVRVTQPHLSGERCSERAFEFLHYAKARMPKARVTGAFSCTREVTNEA